MAVAALLAVLAAAAGVALLAVSGWFLTGAAMAGAGGVAAARGFNYLLPSAAIRAFAVVRTLGRYGERLFSHRAALFALADLRPALFARLAAAAPETALARPGGEVAAQLGSDVDALEDAVVRRVTLPGALAAAVLGLTTALLAGPGSALALLAGLAAMRLCARALAGAELRAQARRRGEALARLKTAFAEYAACPAEIAAYGLGPRIAAAMAVDARELESARLAIVRREALAQGVQIVLAALTVAGVLALAGGGAPVAAAAALAGAAAADAWSGLARSDLLAPGVADAMRRLDALAGLPARVQPPPGTPEAAEPLVIEADGRRCVLAGGERLRIAGSSGAGKSRLLGTLQGLRRDAPERVQVGGVDVRDLGLDRLREIFAIAPQDAGLIAGTVADNLRLSRPGVTDEEMWRALEAVCLADVVRALPHGLLQWLGGDGARLSGGQRKRLSLARALLAGRPWLLLDEPSEGLDPATARRLAANLAVWLDGSRTGLILVSHRQDMHGLAGRMFALDENRDRS